MKIRADPSTSLITQEKKKSYSHLCHKYGLHLVINFSVLYNSWTLNLCGVKSSLLLWLSPVGALEAPLQDLFKCSSLHVISLNNPRTTFFGGFHTVQGLSQHWLVLRGTCRYFSAPLAVSQPLAFSVSQLGWTHAKLSRCSLWSLSH